MEREQGFVVCEYDGALIAGPVLTGNRTSISIPHECPGGKGEVIMVIHTHPGDDELLPSERDLETGREHELEAVCIASSDWKRVKCYAP